MELTDEQYLDFRADLHEIAGQYADMVDRLAIMTCRYERCRHALWWTAALAGLFFFVLLVAVAAVVKG